MPDRNPDHDGNRPEFEVAYYTRELGRPLQREMLQKQLARLGDGSSASGGHGQHVPPAVDSASPEDDRAG